MVLRAGEGDVASWMDERHGDVTSRTLTSSDRTSSSMMTTGLGELGPGETFRVHRHTPAETYDVVSGEGQIILDGVERPLRPGDSAFIPGGTWHGLVTTSSQVLTFFPVLAADSLLDVDYELEDPAAA